MEDLIELGLEASDHLVDVGFDKLPNRVFDPLGHHKDEYEHNSESKLRDQGQNRNRNHDQDRERERDRDRMSTSRNYPQAASERSPSRHAHGKEVRDIRYDPYPDEDIRIRRYSTHDHSSSIRQNETSSSNNSTHHHHHHHHRQQRPRLQHRRSQSVPPPLGKRIAYGTLGAAAGGLLANQAGKASGVKGRNKDVLVTIAGMLVGGLGAGFLEDERERRRKEGKKVQGEWERKNGDIGGERGSGSGSGRNGGGRFEDEDEEEAGGRVRRERGRRIVHGRRRSEAGYERRGND